MKVVIVTWDGGGVTQPAIGLGRLLVERGHHARLLAPRALEERIRATGAEFVEWPADLEFDPGRGRAVEDQLLDVFETVLMGPGLGAALAAEIRREPADAVVVDFLLCAPLFEAERLGVPAVPLVHTPYRHFAGRRPGEDPDATWGWRWMFKRVNHLRQRLGLQPLPISPEGDAAVIATRAPASMTRRASG
jgi:UDP:flavonoid glycosyltransferase YjiC (YdhE family)